MSEKNNTTTATATVHGGFLGGCCCRGGRGHGGDHGDAPLAPGAALQDANTNNAGLPILGSPPAVNSCTLGCRFGVLPGPGDWRAGVIKTVLANNVPVIGATITSSWTSASSTTSPSASVSPPIVGGPVETSGGTALHRGPEQSVDAFTGPSSSSAQFNRFSEHSLTTPCRRQCDELQESPCCHQFNRSRPVSTAGHSTTADKGPNLIGLQDRIGRRDASTHPESSTRRGGCSYIPNPLRINPRPNGNTNMTINQTNNETQYLIPNSTTLICRAARAPAQITP